MYVTIDFDCYPSNAGTIAVSLSFECGDTDQSSFELSHLCAVLTAVSMELQRLADIYFMLFDHDAVV